MLTPLALLTMSAALAETPAPSTPTIQGCELLLEIMAKEIPVVAAGDVRITHCAHLPGYRAKISVQGGDDPVDAVVGPEGAHIVKVVQAMGGMAVDIQPHFDDPAKVAVYAIAPAEVVKIYMDSDQKIMDLVIPDAQLDKARGPDGQHLQLASNFTGWTLNLYRESRASELE